MAKRKSDSDKDDALLPSDILESSPKAKVQCLVTEIHFAVFDMLAVSLCVVYVSYRCQYSSIDISVAAK